MNRPHIISKFDTPIRPEQIDQHVQANKDYYLSVFAGHNEHFEIFEPYISHMVPKEKDLFWQCLCNSAKTLLEAEHPHLQEYGKQLMNNKPSGLKAFLARIFK